MLLWALESPERLPAEMELLLTDRAHLVSFSVINLWEIVIKSGSSRSGFTTNAHRVRRMAFLTGFSELQVTSDHVFEVETLPNLHGDPFDRLLIAQALSEKMRLLTVDPLVLRYFEN